MKQILQHTLALCGSLLALAGCSPEELATEPINGKSATLVATIGSNTDTRTGHEEGIPEGVTVSWTLGDGINLYSGTPSASNTPVAFVCESIGEYNDVGTFAGEQTPVAADTYVALYPATLSHDLKLSMLNQTQAKDGDMAHLGAYDAMRTETKDWKKVNFSPDQWGDEEDKTSKHLASLITFDLKNLPATLGIPTKITLGCIDGSGTPANVFQQTLNDASSMVSTLSLALGDGFTDITEGSNSLKAYLMVAPATIPVGHKLTIAVACSDNTYLFTSKAASAEIKYEAGKRHTATVTGALSWEKPSSDATYTGAETAEAFTGSGTSAADPYLIGSAGQLRTLVEGVNSGANSGYKNKFFKLTIDIRIAMADGADWTPIGNGHDAFRGIFDGDGHIISGAMTGNVQYFGFFGYTYEAAISHLTVDATVSNKDSNVGGIVGYASTKTSISYCTNKGKVKSTSDYVGGIAGQLHNVSTSINCTNQGDVNGAFAVGGIAGVNNFSYILGCTNQGAVQSRLTCSGGIAGTTGGDCFFIACYNTAAVTASSACGGIAAKLTTNSNYVMTCTACYNTGKIAGNNPIGAITGDNQEYNIVSYCQWVPDAANPGLPAFPSNDAGTETKNNVRADLTALNADGVAALNKGIKEWNTANAAGSAKHCAFHFVTGTTAGPTLATGVPTN